MQLVAGDLISIATCDLEVAGARGTGDTTLTLLGPTGTTVTSNDDGCVNNLSWINGYSVLTSGNYTIRYLLLPLSLLCVCFSLCAVFVLTAVAA